MLVAVSGEAPLQAIECFEVDTSQVNEKLIVPAVAQAAQRRFKLEPKQNPWNCPASLIKKQEVAPNKISVKHIVCWTRSYVTEVDSQFWVQG